MARDSRSQPPKPAWSTTRRSCVPTPIVRSPSRTSTAKRSLRPSSTSSRRAWTVQTAPLPRRRHVLDAHLEAHGRLAVGQVLVGEERRAALHPRDHPGGREHLHRERPADVRQQPALRRELVGALDARLDAHGAGIDSTSTGVEPITRSSRIAIHAPTAIPTAPASPSQSAHSRPLAAFGMSTARYEHEQDARRAPHRQRAPRERSARRARAASRSRSRAGRPSPPRGRAGRRSRRATPRPLSAGAVPRQEQRHQQRHAGRRRHPLAGAQPSQVHARRNLPPTRVRRRRPRLEGDAGSGGRKGGAVAGEAVAPPGGSDGVCRRPAGTLRPSAKQIATSADARPVGPPRIRRYGYPYPSGLQAGGAQRVHEQHRARHRPHPARHRGDRPRRARVRHRSRRRRRGRRRCGWCPRRSPPRPRAPCPPVTSPASRPRRSARPPRGRPRAGRACASGSA